MCVVIKYIKYRKCQVLFCTNVPQDHLLRYYIMQLFKQCCWTEYNSSDFVIMIMRMMIYDLPQKKESPKSTGMFENNE